MNTIFGSRNGWGSNRGSGEGDHEGFLTLNQHLTGFLIPQRHLAGLDRLGRSPLRKTVFCRGNLYGCPRSEDTIHQDQP
jgi:hypothetical protein